MDNSLLIWNAFWPTIEFLSRNTHSRPAINSCGNASLYKWHVLVYVVSLQNHIKRKYITEVMSDPRTTQTQLSCWLTTYKPSRDKSYPLRRFPMESLPDTFELHKIRGKCACGAIHRIDTWAKASGESNLICDHKREIDGHCVHLALGPNNFLLRVGREFWLHADKRFCFCIPFFLASGVCGPDQEGETLVTDACGSCKCQGGQVYCETSCDSWTKDRR